MTQTKKPLVDIRRVLSLNDVIFTGGSVLYVMARDMRVMDNWALIYAKQQADLYQVPLLVLFVVAPMFNNGSARHNEWMVTSLQEVAETMNNYKIPFFVRCGNWVETVKEFALEYKVGYITLDFNPLLPVRQWREELAQSITLPVSVVDAHNIVPCFIASNKAEFAAYTFRPKIHKLLGEFLTDFPALQPLAKHQIVSPSPIDWNYIRSFRDCDYTEVLPTKYKPGSTEAHYQLREFIKKIIKYESDRNNPVVEGTSNLSPYIRWGNISAARIALTIKNCDIQDSAKETFLEELIVRRELADNFCYYTKNYTSVKSVHPWAQETIEKHQSDKREYIYNYEQFRRAETHDPLWNAAQNQMVHEGKMHGYMRMYWAKKILEWTSDAQTAIDIALRLNDHYQLDGRDSNGVVGVMWSIAGVHDRAWTERPVFGKIRYMNYAGCKRKFSVKEYEEKYNNSNF